MSHLPGIPCSVRPGDAGAGSRKLKSYRMVLVPDVRKLCNTVVAAHAPKERIEGQLCSGIPFWSFPSVLECSLGCR